MLEIYREKRAEIERALNTCEDVKAACDCVNEYLERIRCELSAQLRRDERDQADRLFRAASEGVRCMLSVNRAQVRERFRPAAARTKKEKLIHNAPYAAMGLSLLLCVFLILSGQTAAAVLCVALAGCAYLCTLPVRRAAEPEYEVTTQADVYELMRLMDRLADVLESLLSRAGEDDLSAAAGRTEPLTLTEGLLEPIQMLLEAGCTRDGAYALKALPQIREALYAQGVETIDYTAENARCFDLFPSEQGGRTIRPALLREGRLILRGQATEEIQ